MHSEKKPREPQFAKLLLHRNEVYPVDVIHYKTKLVTLAENDKVFNTVSASNVKFDFSDFSEEEKTSFLKELYN